jgi:oligopeptide/dipeptide ABC transporter ATP-binding protein
MRAEHLDESYILDMSDLKVQFLTYRGTVNALNGVSLKISKSQATGLIGETGSGKSVTALSIMRLLGPAGRIRSGCVSFQGEDLLTKNEDFMRKIRGARIAMVFQDPMTSLNPTFKVGDQIAEAIVLHQGLDRRRAMQDAGAILRSVGIASPEQICDCYPHQLSGGMAQRVMIGIAISCNPDLLIADEPTTSLDVTVQAQILDLLRGLQQKLGTSILLITHNLGVIAQICQEVGVMYAGRIVEHAPTKNIFKEPAHPYTKALLASTVSLHARHGKLDTIGGTVPDLVHLPTGCAFSPRCKFAKDVCRELIPPQVKVKNNHSAACHFAGDQYLG